MKIYRSLEAIPSVLKNTALTIGNFDGLHLGHQKILKICIRTARERDLLAAVLTFSPHPEKIFSPEKVCMIQTLDQRLEGIAASGADMALVVPFTKEFAGLPGEEFVRKILVKKLQTRTLIVGPDFRFGKSRRGDIPALRKFGRRFGFDIRVVPPVRKKALVVSSSLIRELLKLGHVGSAHQMLGRPYAIEGDVVRGDARGRGLGFPTANIETPNEIIPRGVFLTLFEIGGKTMSSLTNIGVRPTFQKESMTIETHVIDVQKNFYDSAVKLIFLKKIRDEHAFGDSRELTARIRKDLEDARRYFRKQGQSA
jgi:riboflavin kinase / FMN adenylyltransferase